MQLTGLDRLLWALGFSEHCVLLGVLWYRRGAAQFPVFTTLIAFDVIRAITAYLTLRFGSQENYFYVYWTLAILDVTLQLAVAYELAGRVFRPLGAWAPDTRRSFAIVVCASLAIASALTWLAAPATRTLRSAIVIRGEFFSSALMSELLVATIALAVTMGLPWQSRAARLTQGFGIYAMASLLTEGAHSYFGTGKHAYARVSQVRISLYCLCVAYWIFATAVKEPEPGKLPPQLRAELLALQRRAAELLKGFRELRHS
jgi:hypothetical protein